MNHVLKPITEERYWYMLEIVPPAIMDGKGFCVGEPYSHRECTATHKYDQPTFSAFFQLGSKYYEAAEPMTLGEYKAITPAIFHELVRSADRPASVAKPQEPRP